MTSHTKR
jgi:hypothetical protein